MPANQAGKGPQPRGYDTDSFDAGHERVFGKKKPWWVLRDESIAAADLVIPVEEDSSDGPVVGLSVASAALPTLDDVSGGARPEDPDDVWPEDAMRREYGPMAVATKMWRTDQEPPLITPSAPFNQYQVPIGRHDGLGTPLDLPHRDEMVIVLSRGLTSWSTPRGLRQIQHPARVYMENVEFDLLHASEIVAVGLNTGSWVTLWAATPGDITHPAEALTEV